MQSSKKLSESCSRFSLRDCRNDQPSLSIGLWNALGFVRVSEPVRLFLSAHNINIIYAQLLARRSYLLCLSTQWQQQGWVCSHYKGFSKPQSPAPRYYQRQTDSGRPITDFGLECLAAIYRNIDTDHTDTYIQ